MRAAEAIWDDIEAGLVLEKARTAHEMGVLAAERYLQTHPMATGDGSLDPVVRRHPLPSVLIALATGFVLGRIMKRTNDPARMAQRLLKYLSSVEAK
jgi:hypothetical protein